jgi:hypothetical protein
VPIDDRTSTQNYPKPNIANTLADDVGRLRTALDDIDEDMAAKAPTASPTFTGTPAAPTAAADTNTTQVATTAYVVGQAGSTNPVMNGTATVGTSLRFSRQDHVHPSDTSRATSTHVHGNITNAGAIGSTTNLPIITTTSGVLTTGSFGTAANTFCQGNDARLSDTRLTTNSVTFNNAGSGGASGSTFNGSAALTVSYNTLGAAASNQGMFIGTTSVAINRASANLALSGISSIALPGATSGNVTLQPTATAGTTTITLPATTGTVVTSGDTGTVSTTMLANDAVTYAKIQNVSATDRLLGRSTAGAGDVEEITCTAAGRNLLDDADAAAQRTTLGLGTLATQSGTFSGTSSGTNTGDQTITLTGDVTGTGTGSFTTAIGAGVIVDADVNASAAIAGTKISPNFGSQNVVTTGTSTAANAYNDGTVSKDTKTDGMVIGGGIDLPGTTTNLHLRSQDFSTGWTATASSTISVDSGVVAPDGTTGVGKFVCSDTTTIIRRAYVTTNVTATSGIEYTHSIFVKKIGNWRYVRLTASQGTAYTLPYGASFDLDQGVFSGGYQNAANASISNIGNGWWRISYTTSGNTSTSLRMNVMLVGTGSSGSGASAVGVVDEGVYIWGGQFTPVPSGQTTALGPYIRTEAAAVTDAAGYIKINGTTRISGNGDVTANVLTVKADTANSDTTTTATASSLLNGIRTGTPAADIDLQVPTGTNMDAAFTQLAANQSFEWSTINLATAASGFDITVTANTDHTVVGNTKVTGETSGRFLTRKTAANTFVTYRLS